MVTPQEKAGVGCSGEEAGLPKVIPSEEQAAQMEGFASEEEVGWPELRLYLVGSTTANHWLAVFCCCYVGAR